MRPLVACAIALCTTLPLHAETYKWVDENGVTNYSSSPPPSSKKGSNAKVVEDRISVVPTDPNFEKSAEALRQREAKRTEQVEAEYARRQALPPTKPVTYDIYDECPYGADCSAYGYYPGYGYYGGYGPRWRRAAWVAGRPRPSHPIADNEIPSRPARTAPSPIRGAQRGNPPLR